MKCSCGCENETFVDGGKDYCRSGAKDMSKTKCVKLDLIKMKVVEEN